MKTEQGKYTIYSKNSNTIITVVNNETDHFITAVLQTGRISFYSDTTIGNFSESINVDTTSMAIFFNGEFIVKLDSPKYEISYSFANHSEKYDKMLAEFNGHNDANNGISIADYECKMSPQKILYTKNSDVYAYGMLDLLIQKDNDKYYLVANLEKYTYSSKFDQTFSGKVEISSDLVNKLRPVFAFPSISTITEGNNEDISEIILFKCTSISNYADKVVQAVSSVSSHSDHYNSIVTGKVVNHYVEIKLGYVPVKIYY